MAEQRSDSTPMGNAVLDIGDDIGALIIYTREELLDAEIEVSPRENGSFRVHTSVLERQVAGNSLFAALFLVLPAGDYTVWCDAPSAREVTIEGGQVAILDWRDLAVTLAPKDDTSLHGRPSAPPVNPELLPPRYRDGRKVSAAPMGSAPMRFDEQGQVAWDEMWTDFCDLALAGGPPHRQTVLQPATPEAVLGDPAGYALVLAELARGLRLVTTLPVVRDHAPGWIGLQCLDEEMARWLLMAIEVENVAVRARWCVPLSAGWARFSPGYRDQERGYRGGQDLPLLDRTSLRREQSHCAFTSSKSGLRSVEASGCRTLFQRSACAIGSFVFSGPNRARRKRSIGWVLWPRSTRSAMISPTTLQNLNPCPEKPAATATCGYSG